MTSSSETGGTGARRAVYSVKRNISAGHISRPRRRVMITIKDQQHTDTTRGWHLEKAKADLDLVYFQEKVTLSLRSIISLIQLISLLISSPQSGPITWLIRPWKVDDNNSLEVKIHSEETRRQADLKSCQKADTQRARHAGRQISDAWRSGVLTGWDGWDPESVEWAVMHRQTCQAQLAPCDPVREKEQRGRWVRKARLWHSRITSFNTSRIMEFHNTEPVSCLRLWANYNGAQ